MSPQDKDIITFKISVMSLEGMYYFLPDSMDVVNFLLKILEMNAAP